MVRFGVFALLLLTSALTAHARFTAPPAKRCGGVHGGSPALAAVGSARVQAELARFRRDFTAENGPQEVFVVGVGEKTASLVATLQTASPDYAINLPLQLPARVREYRDLSREDQLKISDYLDSKLPRLRGLAHRSLLLIDTGAHAGRLPLIREIFERHYRQYGLRVHVETQALTAGERGPDRFALTPGLAAEIETGALSRVREHPAFDPSAQRFLDQPPALPRDAEYDAVAAAIRAQLSWQNRSAQGFP